MALDRWIALMFMLICGIYGYTAFVGMEASLLPFERNMPFLPNSLPKYLSILAGLVALIVLFGPQTRGEDDDVMGDIDYRRLRDYKLGQALSLLGAMALYAVALRPIGFLAATTLFLFGGAFLLGERRYGVMALTAILGAGVVWYLVQEVLGIFLRPLPEFL